MICPNNNITEAILNAHWIVFTHVGEGLVGLGKSLEVVFNVKYQYVAVYFYFKINNPVHAWVYFTHHSSVSFSK